MKKIILGILSLLTFVVPISAQTAISGRVLDQTDKSPMKYVTVVVKNRQSDCFITGTVTDSVGRYVISGLEKGEYSAIYSYVGYRSDSLDFLVGSLNTNYDLGDIFLSSETMLLGSVEVTAHRDIVSTGLEKQTYNIASNLSQSGGSVLEAIRNLPGVVVDQEGKILLRGSDKVLVLIDGRQSSLTGFGNQKGLDNLSAANVERIEIVNNPSAKYDAQGMAGIINIVYKKELQSGFNGEVSFSYGLGELSSRQQNLPHIMDKYSLTPKYNPAVRLNYRTRKTNLFLESSGMFREKVNSNEFTDRIYDNETPNVRSQFLENREQQQYDIKMGLDWYLSENDQLTIFGLFQDEYHIDHGHVPYDYEDGTRKRFWTWNEDERTWAMNYSMNYTHKFAQTGHKIEASFLYTHGVEDEIFPFTDSTAIRNSYDKTHLVAKQKISDFNIDYVKPLSAGRLEAGAKIRLRRIPITYEIDPGEQSVLDPYLGNWSKYGEDIYALYTNYVFESNRIGIEAGLRMEDAVVKYRIDPHNVYYNRDESYNLFSLFPNIRFSFRLNDSHQFSVFYNRRVDRPDEFDLRPFPKYDDPEILKTGNPYLRPQFTDMGELAYKMKWNGGAFFISGYYKYIHDIYTRVYVAEEESDVINAITQNLNNGKNWGCEVVFEQSITRNWDFNAGFNWYRNVIEGFSGELVYPTKQSYVFNRTEGNTWNLKLNTSLRLPWNLDMQASYIYYAPDVIPQGTIDSRSSLDLGIRKKAFKDKIEVVLSATDILNTFAVKESMHSKHLVIHRENYYETQTVMLGIKYKF